MSDLLGWCLVTLLVDLEKYHSLAKVGIKREQLVAKKDISG